MLIDTLTTSLSFAETAANPSLLGYVGSTPAQQADQTRDSDAWFTPREYVEAARQAMGGIDLDPFSCDQANEVVGATHYFTKEQSALVKAWRVVPDARVFMNPPFSRGMMAHAVNRLQNQYRAHAFTQAVILTNNATETAWFQTLASLASAMCFTNHRIAFWNDDGKRVSGNTRGQTFFYIGQNTREFAKAFENIGIIVTTYRS